MKKTSIAVFEFIEKSQEKVWRRELPVSSYALRFNPKPLTLGNAAGYREAEVVSIFIHSKITDTILQKLPKLRLLVTNSTGYDHIDLQACKQRGITVCNVPFYGENTVAEHTFALILAITRNIVQSANRTKQGKFSLAGLRGFDLKGRTIGVIGTGHIGRHVIRMAHGFEMKILAHDLYPDKTLESHYPLQYVSLEKLLQNSDIITLHAPYNTHTHHLINSKNIGLIKKASVLINTARGGLVETGALLTALKSGLLSAAGLDVLEEEGMISEDAKLSAASAKPQRLATALEDHQLLALDNVLVTPHNAFNSDEAVLRILTTTIENIKAWKQGKPLNIVKEK